MRPAAAWPSFVLIAASAAAPCATAPQSAQAQVGEQLFFERTLSASGRQSCADCHDPANAFAAPGGSGPVMPGGASLDRTGLRAVPSLRYLEGTPRFTRHLYRPNGAEREDVGPGGGFMRDGRADSLHAQALLPLLDPDEMANASLEALAARLRALPWIDQLARASDAPPPDSAAALVELATRALEQFLLEDPRFHPYSSRYDRFLAGTAMLDTHELNGLRIFIDPERGNCAACHPHTSGPGGRGAAFTDFSFHALGVPRNAALAANRDPRFFDLGLCGPRRTDLAPETRYCGFFKTPTLRNVARHTAYFHNGRFDSLREVLEFYASRDTDPQRWYPQARGRAQRRTPPFDDLPPALRINVNTSDVPLNRRRGEKPALSAADIDDLLAFLRTLDDAD